MSQAVPCNDEPRAQAVAGRTRPARSLTLVHASDVHLESDTLGVGASAQLLREQTRLAFSHVISEAKTLSADLILIAGDLFDSPRVEQQAFEFAMDEIARAAMPVVMIPGNHDAHDERSLYGSSQSRLPQNLHVILEPAGKSLSFPGLSLQLWGRALVEHSQSYRPLSGMAPPADGLWNVALAHGLFSEEDEPDRSSVISAAEIEASSYDYIALGHVHVFSDVSRGNTRAAYSGTPAPLSVNRHEGSFALVRMDPQDGTTVERRSVRFEEPPRP